MKAKFILNILFVVFGFELIGELLWTFYDFPFLVYALKPLLMPLMMFWYLRVSSNPLKILLYALFFSFLGDVFIMFLSLSEHFFLAGLASFLVTHVLYIVIFVRNIDKEKNSILRRRPHLILPFVLFGLSLVSYLYRNADPKFIEMQIPVIVYASVIMVMVITAIARFDRVAQKSFSWVMVGALLFMFSDTFIALNNFSAFFDEIKYVARISIMVLYFLGQYLIVKGLLMIEEKHEA